MRENKRQASKIARSACQLLSRLFLDLFFVPEDGGGMFLRNVGWLSANYTALYPRR
jgi:hypothetical protein